MDAMLDKSGQELPITISPGDLLFDAQEDMATARVSAMPAFKQAMTAVAEWQTVLWVLALVLVLCASPFLYDLASSSGWIAK